jgi:molecular chaperone HtpG
VTQDEYVAFYKALTRDPDTPSCHQHFSVDGHLQFTALLFAGKHAPFDGFRKPDDRRSHVHLYVRRVFVMDNCEDLIPEWLDFVKGVVDTNDLPLNVSREMLQQQTHMLHTIRKSLVRRSVDMVAGLAASDASAYRQFFGAFGRKLKIGAIEDETSRERLLELLRFATTASPLPGSSSLAEYVGRMKPGQKHIYFHVDSSTSSTPLLGAAQSPFAEKLVKLGYEVILMDEAVDEYLMQTVREYKDLRFACVARDGLTIPEDDDDTKKDVAEDSNDDKRFLAKVKEVLGARVERVSVSKRLVDSPCVVVVAAYGWTANMERIASAQAAGQDDSMTKLMRPRRILELNIEHPLVRRLRSDLLDAPDAVPVHVAELVQVMYDAASIASGFSPENPLRLAASIFSVLGAAAAGGAPAEAVVVE